MDEGATLEDVLQGGLASLLNPARARRSAGERLPRLTEDALIGRPSEETRRRWISQVITTIYDAVRKERGGRWDLGWTELTAGVLVSIELLAGELPPAIHKEIRGTPAEEAWQTARGPFQRFVLLVDSNVRVRRVHASPWRRTPPEPVEESRSWAVDGPPFRDRSHTLMLALLADGALVGEAGPVAATGEVARDGQRLRPVAGLGDKVRAWRERTEGLLVASEPDEADEPGWAALLRPRTEGHDRPRPPCLIGATLVEITAKLRAAPIPLTGWDGTPLRASALVEPRLVALDTPQQERVTGDALLDASWAAFRDSRSSSGRRGVIIEGPPGAGKSVLTATIASRFPRGAIGGFGYGVRRGARELAIAIEASGSRSWSAVLAASEPQSIELFDALVQTRRLVPIVDGLDELQAAQLRAVADWLRNGDGWWIATSRPQRTINAEFPPARKLRLEELQRADTRRLLLALERRDLADAIVPVRGGGTLPAAIADLTRTPLYVALLARAAPTAESITQLDAHDVYARAFEALLTHASLAGRLTSDAAARIRTLLSSVVGELAIAWLRSDGGVLDRRAIDAVFGAARVDPLEQGRTMDALVFGHLLVPVAASWEFGHRTIAEWTAASALARRMAVRVGAQEATLSTSERARLELEILAPFLDGDIFPREGRWATLLRFYAPFVDQPLALLERLVGPARVSTWRVPARRYGPQAERGEPTRPATSTEVLQSWDFAFELLRHARYEQPSDARSVWAVGVRRWLLTEYERRPRGAQNATGDFAALHALSESVARHLPETLESLCLLAARTPAQEDKLRGEPLLLLPAIPGARAAALASTLERGTRAEQLAVLEWHAHRGVAPSRAVLERLAADLPDEQARSLASLAERTNARGATTEGDGCADHHVLTGLESAVWMALLREGHEPPWRVLRARFAAWPAHLEAALTKWFGKPPGDERWPRSPGEGYRRRRELLALHLGETAAIERGIAERMAALNDDVRSTVIDRVRYYFHDTEDGDLRRTFEGVVSRRGWPKGDRVAYGAIEQEPLAESIRADVPKLESRRKRCALLVGSLQEAAIDAVAGELWALLAPDHPARHELLQALDSGRATRPERIPAMDILRYRGGAGRGSDRTRWTPGHVTQLREAMRTDAGRWRYEAACAYAHATERDEAAVLVEQLPSDDAEFTAAVYDHIARRDRAEALAVEVPDETRLPLATRAARNVPGWHAELLATLASEPGDIHTLVEIVVRHRVRDALPLLAQRLGNSPWGNRPVVEAIAALATDRDEAVARVAVRHALRTDWPHGYAFGREHVRRDDDELRRPGIALARFIRLEDLDSLSEGTVSALRHPTLAAAIRALGAAALEGLLTKHAALSQSLRERDTGRSASARDEFRFEPPDQGAEEVRRRRDALTETIIASLDPDQVTLAALVDVLFRIACADEHHVYGTPGPLGSEYDEPGDLEWHSVQRNQAIVAAAAQLLARCLERQPSERHVLRRLFRHPSESLCKRAFELCAAGAVAHEVAELALEALSGHVTASRTRWTGRTAELVLAAHSRGAGTIEVSLPDTAESLAGAVRRRLTPAHRDFMQTLLSHELAAFRQLGARWAGELGVPSWAIMLAPLLEDAAPRVVGEALQAIAHLAREQLDGLLGQARDKEWTPAHDRIVFEWLVRDRAASQDDAEELALPGIALTSPEGIRPRAPSVPISDATLARLLLQAADRVPAAPESDERRSTSCFSGFPSLVDEVCAIGSRDSATALLPNWTSHRAGDVRVVGLRRAAALGILAPERVQALLVSRIPSERISGAECAVRMSLESVRETAAEIFFAAMTRTPDDDDFRSLALEPPADGPGSRYALRARRLPDARELRARLLWALEGASAGFADLVPLVARDLPIDHSEGLLEPEGEAIVAAVVRLLRRWGPPGAIAILDLMDQRAADDDYTILEEIRRAAEQDDAVLAAVHRGAAAGGRASTVIVADLAKNAFDRSLDLLARQLEDEVFPPGWLMPTQLPKS